MKSFVLLKLCQRNSCQTFANAEAARPLLRHRVSNLLIISCCFELKSHGLLSHGVPIQQKYVQSQCTYRVLFLGGTQYYKYILTMKKWMIEVLVLQKCTSILTHFFGSDITQNTKITGTMPDKTLI